ncbi:hypothetical protein [Tatumella citrea]|uniref:hypothetical protein n=1 Tax=Tatumella citrea TaxID=53336 RepID=UPI0012F9EF70|nr:hypothetical protein [Tatumella citrea]
MSAIKLGAENLSVRPVTVSYFTSLLIVIVVLHSHQQRKSLSKSPMTVTNCHRFFATNM